MHVYHALEVSLFHALLILLLIPYPEIRIYRYFMILDFKIKVLISLL